MGKPTGKKKRTNSSGKLGDISSKHNRSSEHSPRVFDEDTTMFMDLAQDMKEEGNKLFQKRDYDGALHKYEKAIKLLPTNHIDVAYLRSNIAACYMQMGPEKFYQAINECNLALEISPKYSKALLKRAKCFEALNRLVLACKDVDLVLSSEPNNLMALEISERVKKAMEKKCIKLDDKAVVPMPDVVVVKEKPKKKKSHKTEVKKVVKEEKRNEVKEEPMRVVKLVFGEDIRWAQLPVNCSMLQLREIVGNKFPGLKAILIKYKDKEGDLVTITTSEELRWAEESADPQGSLRLYIAEVNPEYEPWIEEAKSGSFRGVGRNPNSISESGSIKNDDEKDSPSYIDDYIIQFSHLFKNHVGINSDVSLDLHDLGMKLYSEAIEETVTSEEAQGIFELTEEKFQEMTALALFKWGNVHMSRARKRLFFSEDISKESLLEKIKAAYEWAKAEFVKAGEKYTEALKIKPDFYEGFLALGQQQFEQAKLSWCYAIAIEADVDNWPSKNVLELFNNAEDSMERGADMWEKMEENRLNNLSTPSEERIFLQKLGLDNYFKELSTDEAAELASNMRSQINILWGTMLYERSIVEFRTGLPTWEDALMAAMEKFKLAGVSPGDIALMIKNHCANETTQDGRTFGRSPEPKYKIEIHPVDTPFYPEEGQESIAMSSKEGQSYTCFMPTIDETKNSKPVSPQNLSSIIIESERHVKLKTPDEILDVLKDRCFYNHESWWSYEFCYQKHVKQLHVDGDKIVQEFVLGSFDPEATDAFNKNNADISMLKDPRAKDASQRYHAHQYTNGTICDLTNQPRETEVRFVCSEPNVLVSSIKEISTCKYVVMVHSPMLCKHPMFQQEKPTRHTIHCNELPGDIKEASTGNGFKGT